MHEVCRYERCKRMRRGIVGGDTFAHLLLLLLLLLVAELLQVLFLGVSGATLDLAGGREGASDICG